MANDGKFVKVGAGWKKTSRNGNEYISMNLKVNGNDVFLTLLENGYKKEAKHPDYIVRTRLSDADKSGIDIQDRSRNSSEYRAQNKKESRYKKPNPNPNRNQGNSNSGGNSGGSEPF